MRGLMMKIVPLSLSLLATAKQIGSGSVVSDRPGDLLPGVRSGVASDFQEQRSIPLSNLAASRLVRPPRTVPRIY